MIRFGSVLLQRLIAPRLGDMPHFEPCDLEAEIALAGTATPSPRTMEASRSHPGRAGTDGDGRAAVQSRKDAGRHESIDIEVNERQARSLDAASCRQVAEVSGQGSRIRSRGAGQLAFLIRNPSGEFNQFQTSRGTLAPSPKPLPPTTEADGVFPSKFPSVQVILPARSS